MPDPGDASRPVATNDDTAFTLSIEEVSLLAKSLTSMLKARLSIGAGSSPLIGVQSRPLSLTA